VHNDGGEYINTAEAAEVLGISVQWANKLAASGRLRTAYKLRGDTGARLFVRAEVERIAQDRKATA
jgi:hypothetical protein